MREEEVHVLIERIDQIDELLKPAVSCLAGVYRAHGDFSAAIRADGERRFNPGQPITRAICASTLQRLWRMRRRFPFLDSEWEALGDLSSGNLTVEIATTYTREQPARVLSSREFGDFDPLTASQVIWVVLNAGEEEAYSPLAFACLYSILLSLQDESGDGQRGAKLRGKPSTAWVTAKALAPLFFLVDVCTRRADLISELASLVEKSDPSTVVRLTARTNELLRFSLAGRYLSDEERDYAGLELLRASVARFASGGALLAQRADRVLERIEKTAVASLKSKSAKAAARRALHICREVSSALQTMLNEAGGGDRVELSKRLQGLADGNERVARLVREAVEPAVRWCRVELSRQVAYASSRDWTHYDSGEVIGALHVAVASGLPISHLTVEDAIQGALEGQRDDGSWVAGQPFFEHHGMGMYPPTADLLWTLSSACLKLPAVAVERTDEIFGTYLDWLERNRAVLRWGGRRCIGWRSERHLSPDRIDLWVTSFAVNSLLEIRDLMEFRLWQQCEDRFTTVRKMKPLAKIDPVDLQWPPAYRLHDIISENARLADSQSYRKAEYSFVLHGPPGTSKTALAEAIATEYWREAQRRRQDRLPRLVRITPADFTRMGEARLDSEARLIFTVLSRIRGATILFDEIDDLLRRRDNEEVTFLKLVVPAMLNRLQDLRDVCPRQELCFLIATNYVDRIEPALMRQGRVDRTIPVVYPDRNSREAIANRLIGEESSKAISSSLKESDFLPWKAFTEACHEVKRSSELEPGVIKAILERYQRRRVSLDYTRRLSGGDGRASMDGSRVSRELCQEIVLLALSAASTQEEAKERIKELVGDLQKGSATKLLEEEQERLLKMWSEKS